MKASLPAKVLGATLVVVLVALASGSALAFFTTTGSGSASADVSKLSTPSITSATPAVGGTVALSWAAITPPGIGAVTYTLTRDGGAPAGNCPSSSSPAQVTTCTDSGVGIGTHSYVLTARWRSWSTSSSTATAKITVGPATHFDLKAASATPTAGATDNLTITAQDANGSTVTTYTGSKSLTFSGASAASGGTKPTVSNSSGTAINFGTATAITFSSGVASVTTTKNGVMRLYKSGATSIDVSDGTISSSPSLSVTVGSTTATKITLGLTTTTPVAGAANNATITATDTYGNTAVSYTGPKSLTFSGPSTSTEGNVPTVSDSSGVEMAFGTPTTIGFNAGIASVDGAANGVMKLYKSGSATPKVTEGSLSSTVSVTVSPATASRLSMTAASATPTAGVANNLTITAFDPYGNTATGYTGAKSLIFSGASASLSGSLPTVVNNASTAINFGSATAITFSSGAASVSSSKNGVMKIGRAGPASIVVSDGTISNATTSLAVTVSPTTPTKLAYSNVSISAGALGSTCLFTCSVTGLGNSGTALARVNATDSFGNTVSNIGTGHAVKVTANGGTISGGTLTFPSTGPAESPTQFTYTAPASGAYSNTITAATSEGTAYTSATFATSR